MSFVLRLQMTKACRVHCLRNFLIAGDWTAFVPAMRPFLQLKSLDDISLKREPISISDIELVTDRMIKVGLRTTHLICQMDGTRRTNPTANEDVRNEMLDLYKDLGSLNEIDWSKVRDMSFNEDKTNKRVAAEKIATSHCLECPDFLEHVLFLSTLPNFSMPRSMKNISFVRKSRTSET